MNVSSAMRDFTDDPTFFVLGSLSVLVVLVALYRGGWKYITGTVLGAANLVLNLVTLFTGRGTGPAAPAPSRSAPVSPTFRTPFVQAGRYPSFAFHLDLAPPLDSPGRSSALA